MAAAITAGRANRDTYCLARSLSATQSQSILFDWEASLIPLNIWNVSIGIIIIIILLLLLLTYELRATA